MEHAKVTMTDYYNEIDPYAAQWIRNLINAGHLPPGIVDERSIEDVRPSDLRGFRQCHFFAGIGVWALALQRSGWTSERSVWTGSCPCQPFSAAGKGAGFDDERHLWPAFHHLIKECKPATVFGEQVASKAVDAWVDLVHADLEAVGYAFGSVPFPSASVGAPHIRDRNYWCATRLAGRGLGAGGRVAPLANTDQHGCGAISFGRRDDTEHHTEPRSELGGLEHTRRDDDASQEQAASVGQPQADGPANIVGRPGVPPSLLGDTIMQQRPDGKSRLSDDHYQSGRLEGAAKVAGLCGDMRPGPTNGLWADADWLHCRDGRWRAVEPGTFPLAHGASSRVVYTCARCKTETVDHENLRTLRRLPPGYEGLIEKAILLNGVLREVDKRGAENAGEWSLSSAIQICRSIVQSVRQHGAFGSASQGREPDEQLTGEHRSVVSQMPCSGTPAIYSADARVQGVREGLSGTTVEELDLFCPVCAGMGPHKRSEEVGPSRVGRLRAYGNAINAIQAQIFIESVMA